MQNTFKLNAYVRYTGTEEASTENLTQRQNQHSRSFS